MNIKIVEVEEAVLLATRDTVLGLIKSLNDAGKKLDPTFSEAPVFDRPHPIEAIASLLYTAKQASEQLVKATCVVETLRKERDEAFGVASESLDRIELLSKGAGRCSDCNGIGAKENQPCKTCSGHGLVSR